MRFRDRSDAGRKLADRLAGAGLRAPVVVVGLPRGGVPVAAEVARSLAAPLDVLVVRKLGCPWQPELGVGALGEGGTRILNRDLLAELHLSAQDLKPVIAHEQRELDRRVRRFRGSRPPAEVAGRTVVVVDDGIATGFTARAAMDVLRRRGPRSIVLAVPVAPLAALVTLGAVADEVVCLHTPEVFWALGEFYRDFTQVSDDEVAAALAAASAVPAAPAEVRQDVRAPGGTEPEGLP